MKNYLILNRKLLIVAAFVFMGASVASFSAVSTVSAEEAPTKTWVGTACESDNVCLWSEAANWQGGVAPVNGDNVTINYPQERSSYSTIDIPDLVINNLNVTGYHSSFGGSVLIAGVYDADPVTNLMVTGDISLTAPEAEPLAGLYTAELLSFDDISITLESNSTFTNVYVEDETLNLNNHSLTVKTSGINAENRVYSFGCKITGDGTVNYDLPLTQILFLGNENDYSGVTNLISMDYAASLVDSNVRMFGSSDVNVGPLARILYKSKIDATIDNKITIYPPEVTGTFLSNQIEFWGYDDSHKVTYTVPNIVLLGDVRLGSNNFTIVDLAGITANGHCIQYDNGRLSSFINGPEACVVNVNEQDGVPSGTTTTKPTIDNKVTVKVPDTAIQKLPAMNPVIVMMLGIISVVSVAVARRQFSKK